MFHLSQSKCILCEVPRQVRKNGLKIKNVQMFDVGSELQYGFMVNCNILVGKRRLICINCVNEPITMANQMYESLKCWNNVVWSIENGKNVTNKIMKQKLQMLSKNFQLNKIVNGTNIVSETKNIWNQIQYDLFANEPIPTLQKHYKRLFGINRDGIRKIVNEVLLTFESDCQCITLDLTNGMNGYTFDKNDVPSISCDILMLFAKWKMALPNATISTIFQMGRHLVAVQIYRGTALLLKYADKWLINTKKKLANERPSKLVCQMLGVKDGMLFSSVCLRCKRSIYIITLIYQRCILFQLKN